MSREKAEIQYQIYKAKKEHKILNFLINKEQNEELNKLYKEKAGFSEFRIKNYYLLLDNWDSQSDHTSSSTHYPLSTSSDASSLSSD